MEPKVIIVTGASRGTCKTNPFISHTNTNNIQGIGLAVCEYLLQTPQSSKLVIVARGKQQLEDMKSQYPDDQVQVLAGDLTNYSLGKKAVNLALSKWGKLDGMVLNHGTLGPVDKIANNDPNDWRSCFETNLFSSIAFVSSTLPTYLEAMSLTVHRSLRPCHLSVPQREKSFSRHLVLLQSTSQDGARTDARKLPWSI